MRQGYINAINDMDNPLSNPFAEKKSDLSRRKLMCLPSRTGQDMPPKQEQAPSLEAQVVGLIRIRSSDAQITPYQSLIAKFVSVEALELESVIGRVQVQTEYQDIVELCGEKDRYFYSNCKMSANYARMLFTMEERDICTTIAEAVRFECRTYPRPYPVTALGNLPYCYTPEQVDTALTQMKHKTAFEDILPVYASNDALYLFSTQFMTQAYARGLCEWIEVEQYDNP